MAYSDSITINDRNITDLGLSFVDFGPWHSGPGNGEIQYKRRWLS